MKKKIYIYILKKREKIRQTDPAKLTLRSNRYQCSGYENSIISLK